jgi:hypothetical protein
VRHDDAAAALTWGARLRRVWAGHPHRVEVRACDTFEQKTARVELVLRQLGLFPVHEQ